MSKVTINVRIDPVLLEKVEALAKSKNRNRSNYIETLLKDVVDLEEKLTN